MTTTHFVQAAKNRNEIKRNFLRGAFNFNYYSTKARGLIPLGLPTNWSAVVSHGQPSNGSPLLPHTGVGPTAPLDTRPAIFEGKALLLIKREFGSVQRD
ncbi:hypothetical protein GWI33_011926 [Rhynchophorus ferrugineus]|uniref:Uncharacterized protein n=1 Tax=Rhynchophorus ferrugineus TaxID=354439 RepID=A0A834MLW1_RHYFE|nr:hypothetical protein GWI33_011926 [Rhynchophorus ferrugineus]